MSLHERPAVAEYLDEAALHDRYQIPPRTAQRWRVNGEGPPYVRVGARRIAYRVADVERWLAERTYAHRADELSRRTNAVGDPGPKREAQAAVRAPDRPKAGMSPTSCARSDGREGHCG
jgi:hypothetical protein